MVAQAIVPDYALGAHTASLGLSFAEGNSLPPAFASGAFVGQHGSWNRDPHGGYQVIFVPFEDGEPVGEPLHVLTGFLNDDEKALGRPVGVAIDDQGPCWSPTTSATRSGASPQPTPGPRRLAHAARRDGRVAGGLHFDRPTGLECRRHGV